MWRLVQMEYGFPMSCAICAVGSQAVVALSHRLQKTKREGWKAFVLSVVVVVMFDVVRLWNSALVSATMGCASCAVNKWAAVALSHRQQKTKRNPRRQSGYSFRI